MQMMISVDCLDIACGNGLLKSFRVYRTLRFGCYLQYEHEETIQGFKDEYLVVVFAYICASHFLATGLAIWETSINYLFKGCL